MVMRGVAMNKSLVAVEEGIKSGVGVRVAVGVRDGLKKKGVLVGVDLSDCAGRAVKVMVGGRRVFVRVGVGVRVGGDEVAVLGVPTTMVSLLLLPSAVALTVYSPGSENMCPIWHFPVTSVVQSPIPAPSTEKATLTPDFGVPFSSTSAVSVTGVLGEAFDGTLKDTVIPPWAKPGVHSEPDIRMSNTTRLEYL